jgi:hypothetical protein
MDEQGCHGTSAVSPREAAKELILKTLGVKRVAAWTSRSEDTVYQWLSRGTDDEPVPPRVVPAIVLGARREGIEVPVGVLCPAMGQAVEP